MIDHVVRSEQLAGLLVVEVAPLPCDALVRRCALASSFTALARRWQRRK
jgi:hypothetical protein